MEITQKEIELFKYYIDYFGLNLQDHIGRKRRFDAEDDSDNSNSNLNGEKNADKKVKKTDFQSVLINPKCPLCLQYIDVLPGEDPNEKVDEHIESVCSKQMVTRRSSTAPINQESNNDHDPNHKAIIKKKK